MGVMSLSLSSVCSDPPLLRLVKNLELDGLSLALKDLDLSMSGCFVFDDEDDCLKK